MIDQIPIIRIAITNAHFDPSHPEAVVANLPKASPLDSMAIWEDSRSNLSFDLSFEEPRCGVFMCSFAKGEAVSGPALVD